jgi:hypothetical protein
MGKVWVFLDSILLLCRKHYDPKQAFKKENITVSRLVDQMFGDENILNNIIIIESHTYPLI